MPEKHFRKKENGDPRKNAEGYMDLTAHDAIKNVEDEAEKFNKLKGCILRVCELAGYKFVGEIAVRDRKTGKIWRC